MTLIESIQFVTSAFTLIAFLAAAYYYYQKVKIKSNEKMLRHVREEERGSVIKALADKNDLDLDLATIKEEDRYRLALEQLHNQRKDQNGKLVLFGFIALLLTIVIITVTIISSNNSSLSIEEPLPKVPQKYKGNINVGIVKNGSDLYYADDITRGFQEEAEQLFENIQFCVKFGSPLNDSLSKEINRRAFQDVINFFPEGKIDYLLTVGTRVSLYAKEHFLDNIPIIFAGVTDPVKVGLVDERDKNIRSHNITGIDYGQGGNPQRLLTILSNHFNNDIKYGFLYTELVEVDILMRDMIKELNARSDNYLDIKFINIPEPRNKSVKENIEIIESDPDFVDIEIYLGYLYAAQKYNEIARATSKPFIFVGDRRNIQPGVMMLVGNDDDKNIGREAAGMLFKHLSEVLPLKQIPIKYYTKFSLGINKDEFIEHEIRLDPNLLNLAERFE